MASGWHRKTNDAAARARAASYRTPEYRAAEAAITEAVAVGVALCWRPDCRRPLPLGKDRLGRRLWHVGHDDDDRRIIRGGECASCNLRKAASQGARVANARRKAARSVVTALSM